MTHVPRVTPQTTNGRPCHIQKKGWDTRRRGLVPYPVQIKIAALELHLRGVRKLRIQEFFCISEPVYYEWLRTARQERESGPDKNIDGAAGEACPGAAR